MRHRLVVLTIVLICLMIQRWLCWDRYARKHLWFETYFLWLQRQGGQWPAWSGLLGMCVVVLPALLIYLVFAFLLYHWLSIVGYYLLNLVVLWYFLDARLLSVSAVNVVTHDHLKPVFMQAYQTMFAVIFWFSLLGAPGVLIYCFVNYLKNILEKPAYHLDRLLVWTQWVLNILDWLPLRALGISYALVGDFIAISKSWRGALFSGFDYTQEKVAESGLMALKLPYAKEEAVTSESASSIDSRIHLVAIDALLNRVLWVWLVAIALFTIGYWIR